MLMRALIFILTAIALSSLRAHAAESCHVLDTELVGSYSGGCKDGLAEGYGEAKGVAEYRGEFHAGRKQGKGIKIWPSGDRYEGHFVGDRKEGEGKYTWSADGPSAGQSYVGRYRNDRRNGYGVYTWPSGDRYAGQWVDDAIAGAPTQMMTARARAETETLAAVARAGVKVCRALPLGIAVRDWISGRVTAVKGERLEVRIDDPGSQPHLIGNAPLAKGMTIETAAADWKPCL